MAIIRTFDEIIKKTICPVCKKPDFKWIDLRSCVGGCRCGYRGKVNLEVVK